MKKLLFVLPMAMLVALTVTFTINSSSAAIKEDIAKCEMDGKCDHCRKKECAKKCSSKDKKTCSKEEKAKCSKGKKACCAGKKAGEKSKNKEKKKDS